jgi:hypothetical protein
MIHPALRIVLRAALASALLSLALPAQAGLYRWVDQNGNVTYSNVPPPEGAQVRDVQTLDDGRTPTAAELRTRQILEQVARERRANSVLEAPVGQTASSRNRGTSYVDLDPAGAKYEWVPQGAAHSAAPAFDSAQLRYPPATPVTVRDPCLLSADPRCYQINAANYDPYLGYAPNRETAPLPTGATSDAGRGAIGANVATATFPGIAPRNVSTETVGASVVPAAAAQTPGPAPRGFRGLPPGTPVLPIGR